jgi:hypothetical protein
MEEAVRLNAAAPAGADVDTESMPRCEHALDLLLTHRGNPAAEVDGVLAGDPRCVFGHCLRAALIVCADAVAARSSLAASVDAIEAMCPDIHDPARRHAAAAAAWLAGDSALAVERYGAIVTDCPRDILALVVAHTLDFRLGRRRMMRDRIAQVLPELETEVPGYASVLAMYAFALEENGRYRRAEKISAWIEGTGFSVHLAWHRALFHLDSNHPECALATYDSQIANARALGISVLADASALLWRLQLRNIEVSGRWRVLADRWEMQSLAGARPFYVVHAMMAFAAAGRAAAAARVFEALPHTDTSGTSLSLPEDALAPPFCEALLAFARSDYAACVEWLTRVRHIAHRCGGSLAQCDLIHLTFTEAALRARKSRLARALVAERAEKKPASLLNRLLRRRLRMIVPAIA